MDIQESNTLTDSSGSNPASPPPFETTPFDINLLYLLACLKAVNFRHIVFIARDLENIPISMAYKILWHEAMPQSLNTYRRLKKLCDLGWVLPWRLWDPDKILTYTPGRAHAKESDVYYVIGKKGRDWVQSNLQFKPTYHVFEELYNAVPIARWLTASTCALTLDQEGAKILPRSDVWKDININLKPSRRPDFFVRHKEPMAFYICDSPFAMRSDELIQQILDCFYYVDSKVKSVVLTYTEVALNNVFISMQKNSADERISRIYLGDLEAFKNTRGHCTVINAREEREVL